MKPARRQPSEPERARAGNEVCRLGGRLCQLRTFTYEPGPSSIAGNAPLPGWRAGTCSPERPDSQTCHSGHHDPGCSVAIASQPSTVSKRCSLSFVQCWYLFAAGGFTTPAICPEPASMKRTGPEKIFVALNTERYGTMWSSLAACRYIGILTFERSIGTPRNEIAPGCTS